MNWTNKLNQKVTLFFTLISVIVLIYNTVINSKQNEQIASINLLLSIKNFQELENKQLMINDINNKVENNYIAPIIQNGNKQNRLIEKKVLAVEDWQVAKYDSLVTRFYYLIGQLDSRVREYSFTFNSDSNKQEIKRIYDSLSLKNHNVLSELEGVQSLIDISASKLDSIYLIKSVEIKKELKSLKSSRLY